MAGVSFVGGHIDEKQTNYDRIRNMSVEEMAEFINERSPCDCCKQDEGETCMDMLCEVGIKHWLESEVEGE